MNLKFWKLLKGKAERHGLGWVPNDFDERDVTWTPKATARPAKLPLLSLERFIPKILNQGATGSCVGQAVESSIAIRESLLGLPYNPPSARAVYLMARATHGSLKDDSGTYPRAAWKVLGKHGCPLKNEWPWDAAKINDIPPSVMLLNGFKNSGFRYEHIFELGNAKLERIRLAIGEGYPVFFGTEVHDGFALHTGPGVYAPRGRSLGGHAMVIVGSRPEDGAFRVLNSWGRSWGDGGLAWVDPMWVMAEFRDLTIARGWPAERAYQKDLGR